MLRKTILSLPAMFALCAFHSVAHAQFSASPIILHYTDGGQNRQDITLTNNGDRPQYLEIKAFRIQTPGAQPEELTADPNPKNTGLLVAPRRVVLKPGQQKIIRVILLDKDMTADKAWRVAITPAKVKIESEGSGAIINIAYKALIVARPKNATAPLIVNKSGNQLSVKNTGNSNALLYEGEQCNAQGKDCERITGKRLWPGTSWNVTLPYTTKVKFTLQGPEGNKDVQY